MEEFIRAVKGVSKKVAITTVGIVKEVKGLSCVVEREGLPELLDVRLQAINKDFVSFFLIVPKVGSEVLCLEVENQPAETVIIKYTEIERIEVKVGGAEWTISNSGKFRLKNEKSNLKEILTRAFDTVSNATITTPSGPGFFSVGDKHKLAELKKQTLNLFE